MRSAVQLLLLLGFGFVLAACGRGASAPAPAAPRWSPVPESAREYYDNSGGIRDSLRQVVRDAETMQKVWKEATSKQTSPAPLPNVDFSREMVLVVAAGRMSAEDEIHVDSVDVRKERDERGKDRDVMVALVRSVEGCRRVKAVGYPVEIVRVRRFDGPVRFAEQRVQAEGCGPTALRAADE
jgi:hypothetical protein